MKKKHTLAIWMLGAGVAAIMAEPAVASDKVAQPPRTATRAEVRRVITDPVTRFTLSNGLRVIVQTNRRLPLVTAAVSYNVGSKDEQPGQYGYAHLFEHLMINGSANWKQDVLHSMAEMGATNSNATTTLDTTLFYETFPRAALDRILFLEADRMGNIAGALTPEGVKKEVGVVLNELRQRRSEPYGGDQLLMLADLYPADHPYHHDVGGNEVDLNAVTVDAARAWFDRYYGPSNATLVLVGDIGPEEARPLVEKYFGGLKPRLPINQLLTRSPVLTGPIRRQVFEAVPQGQIYALHLAPPGGTPMSADLDLIAQLLANGTRSRLNRELVEGLGIAQSAEVMFEEGALSSYMGFVLTGVPDERMAQAEAALDAAMAKFIAEGPTPEELERARAVRLAFAENSQSSTFGKALFQLRNASPGNADSAETYVRRLREATPESIRRAAQAVYGQPGYRLLVRPTPPLTPAPGGYDLTKGPPPMGALAPIAFPAVEQATLSNGMKVLLVPRPGTDSANMLLRFKAGASGTSRFVSGIALDLLAGKAPTAAQRQRGEQVEALDGWLGSDVAPDHADLMLTFATAKLAPGVALLGDVLTRPDVAPEAVTALREAQVNALSSEGTNVRALGERALLNTVYGPDHPLGRSASAADDVKMVQSIDTAAVRAWSRSHLRPDRATLYVAADTDMAHLRPLLEKALAGWTNEGPAAAIAAMPSVSASPAPSLTVIDRPGDAQVYLQASRLLPQATGAEADAMTVVNQIYGGSASGRIGSNLRSDKGWTYGADSSIFDVGGPRRWVVASYVDVAHTGEAIGEITKELVGLTGNRPPQQAEIDAVISGVANRAASRLEANGDLVTTMAESETDGRAYDAGAKRPAQLRALTLEQIRGAAADLSNPKALHWIIVGDWQKIRSQLQGLNIGEAKVIAAGG